MSKPPSPILVNDKRTINAWAMFDWANSSYALVIAVAIFPIYFDQMLPQGNFIFWGIELDSTSLLSYSLALAYLLVALSLPLLSGIADYGGKKLLFMKIFTTIGSLACLSLWFFTDDSSTYSIGVIGFIVAVIGFAGGQVFYNAFLPLIATEDQYDRVSAKGFTYGYIGSVILLVANLVMIQKYEWFGFPDAGIATRASFITVGIWWLGFAQITFKRLPKDTEGKISSQLLSKGYEELKKVWKTIKDLRNTKRFLFAFFFYSAGVQTVIYLASKFASTELKFESTDLIITILLLQIVAIVGAYLFSLLSAWKGNKFSIIVMLFIWIGICVMAYFVQQKIQFYVIAALVGMVMGGIQSLSRSTYSKLIPPDTQDTASFFSFFDVLEKVAIVLGTLSFGLINQMMGGMRNSILALIVYFVIGLLILMTVRIQAPFAEKEG